MKKFHYSYDLVLPVPGDAESPVGYLIDMLDELEERIGLGNFSYGPYSTRINRDKSTTIDITLLFKDETDMIYFKMRFVG